MRLRDLTHCVGLLANVVRTEWSRPEVLRALQRHRLAEQVAFASRHVPFYQKALTDSGVDSPALARGDLTGLPIIRREQIQGDPEAFLRQARETLREATGLHDMALTWSWQEHRDWSVLWKQGLGPRTITDRLVIAPSWCEVQATLEAPVGAVVVTIDPGMAFGTAEHETTRGALRLLDRALSPGEKLLDAGCGSAILAIAAARLGALEVLAVDTDPYACEAARENADVNGVIDSVRVEEVAVTPDWLRGRGPYDGILANIQAGVLVPLLEGFAGALKSGGWLILSGIMEDEWLDVSRSATLLGFELESVDEEGEWRSGWFTASAE